MVFTRTSRNLSKSHFRLFSRAGLGGLAGTLVAFSLFAGEKSALEFAPPCPDSIADLAPHPPDDPSALGVIDALYEIAFPESVRGHEFELEALAADRTDEVFIVGRNPTMDLGKSIAFRRTIGERLGGRLAAVVKAIQSNPNSEVHIDHRRMGRSPEWLLSRRAVWKNTFRVLKGYTYGHIAALVLAHFAYQGQWTSAGLGAAFVFGPVFTFPLLHLLKGPDARIFDIPRDENRSDLDRLFRQAFVDGELRSHDWMHIGLNHDGQGVPSIDASPAYSTPTGGGFTRNASSRIEAITAALKVGPEGGSTIEALRAFLIGTLKVRDLTAGTLDVFVYDRGFLGLEMTVIVTGSNPQSTTSP